MATLGTYYFDTASFANATTIYDDADLTVVSANGFYSDNSIVREQVSGVLFAGQSCTVPTPTPTPTPSPTPTPTPTPSPTPGPTPSPTPSPTPGPTPGPTPSPSPSPSPSPVPNQYQIQNCSSGLQENVSLPQAVSVGSSIQWQSVCWEVMGAPTGTTQAISPQGYFANCTDCQPTPSPSPSPTPSPTPTPLPCYYLQLKWNPLAVCSGSSGSYYGDFSNFCTATKLYTDVFCTQLAPSGYYTTFGFPGEYRFWDGTGFTTFCSNC
jgi:hypothetical protein